MTGARPPLLPPLVGEAHVCTTCDMAFSDTSVDAAVEEIRATVGLVRRTVDGLAATAVTGRPEPSRWSVLEYVCHLRDVFETSTIRLHWVSVAAQVHVEPMFNDLRAARFRYNERVLSVVLDELTAAAEGLCEEVAAVSDEAWSHAVERLPAERRSARWLVRNAAHEARHHLADIAALATSR